MRGVAIILLLCLAPSASALDVSLATLRVTGPVSVASLDPRLDGSGVVIAIIDTGVHDAHESFRGARIGGVDVSLPCDPLPGEEYDVSCYAQSNPDDASFHGTGVAGIALGRGDASGRLRGVAPGAKLVEIKAADSIPTGVHTPDAGGLDYQHTLQAIRRGFLYVERWNAEHSASDRIDIASCSCSVPLEDDSVDLRGAAERLVDLGVVVVSSAGNCGTCGPDHVGSPAISPKVIAAGGLDDGGTPDRGDDAVWEGSTRGPNGDARKPDVIAPAVDIESPEHLPGEPSGASLYNDMTGTSAAAPHVAGVAALLLEAVPSLTPAEVKDILIKTTYGSPIAGQHDAAWGWGAVDAHAAVRSLYARVNRAPVATFALPSGHVGEALLFAARARSDPEGKPLLYRWDFGDGNASTNASERHAFSAPGNFTVRLVVEDPIGATAELARVVEVLPLPPIALVASVERANGTTDAPLRFNASGSGHGALAYRWEFGDGTATDGPTPSHTYVAAGAYVANVTLTDAAGRVVRASVNVAVVWAPLEVSIEHTRPRAPDGPHLFTARGAPANASILWRFGDATATGLTLQRALPPGQHAVRIEVRTPDGRQANATIEVTVAAPSPPTAQQETAPPSTSAGEADAPLPVVALRVPDAVEPGVAFVADAAASIGLGLRYRFSFDGASADWGAEPRVGHTFDAEGQHMVVVSVVDLYGRMANATAFVSVEHARAEPPTPAPRPSPDAVVDVGMLDAAVVEDAPAPGDAQTPAPWWLAVIALALAGRRLSAR